MPAAKPVLINKALKDSDSEKVDPKEDPKVLYIISNFNILTFVFIADKPTSWKEIQHLWTPRFGRSLLERLEIASQESKIYEYKVFLGY